MSSVLCRHIEFCCLFKNVKGLAVLTVANVLLMLGVSFIMFAIVARRRAAKARRAWDARCNAKALANDAARAAKREMLLRDRDPRPTDS